MILIFDFYYIYDIKNGNIKTIIKQSITNFLKRKSMKTVKILAVAALVLVSFSTAKAQFAVGTDIVSNYVWRGVQQDASPKGSPNIQPYVSFTAGKLTIGSWGSYSILSTVKEVDLYATFAFSSLFSVTVTDYNWLFTGGNYFDYSGHVFEGSLNYAGVESFPLSVSLNTMFAGADKKADNSQAYSTYFELGYPIAENVKLSLGGVANESPNFYTTGLALTNISLKASKSIEISDKFSLPVYGVVGFNPNAKDAFMVLGITL